MRTPPRMRARVDLPAFSPAMGWLLLSLLWVAVVVVALAFMRGDK